MTQELTAANTALATARAVIKNGKVYRDGSVAVLYSPGYGAGWYTWSHDLNTECLFSPVLVAMVLAGVSTELIAAAAKRVMGQDFYTAGARDLAIEWLPEGTLFRIQEYDGCESVETMADSSWVKA